jgi:arabinogalactan endo-1,4-beta-galactosidase
MATIFKLFVITILLIACKKNEGQVVVDPPSTSKAYAHTKFVMGADLSYLNAMVDNGAIFSHEGKKSDPYVIFKATGTNVVRIRLWHTPRWQDAVYGSMKYSNLDDVIKTISMAKKNGMAVNLDLHYSDDWADPSKQETPAAWKNLPLTTLSDSVYNYTLKVLNTLKAKELTPEYIQIGNENNSGMCAPKGNITNGNYTNFATLLKSGIKAVRDFSTTSTIKPQIILHVAQLQNAAWWTEGVVTKAGVTDFDIIGLSHYFKWSDIHTMAGVTEVIKTLKTKYNKNVMIVETAFPWTNDSKDPYSNIINGNDNKTGFEVSKTGQLSYMKALVQAIIDGGGNGIMYWEPAWVSTPTFKDRWGTGSSWENNAYFDFTNATLPVVEFMTSAYNF